VKRLYPDWDDRYEDDGSDNEYAMNKVEVEEGHKLANGRREGDPNLTELYIERGINISIRRLVKKPRQAAADDAADAAAAGGGYTRRRQSKRNNKITRKI
jgi:hypothetical protein